MINMQKIKVYTDGGARGNPGPAGVGVVFCNTQGAVIKKYNHFIGQATNNQAEYQAVIFALKKTKQVFGKKKVKQMNVEFYLDSELVARQLQGKYKIKEKDLQPLFLQIWNLKLDFGLVSFSEIPRNQNREADFLVNQAIDGVASKKNLGI